MSGSLIEVMVESERRTNRSWAIASLWVVAVLTAICLIGLTGAFGISYKWMLFYAGAIILPMLVAVAYARARDYRGREIKYLMVLTASLVPSGFSVPSLLGFFLVPLPIVVSGRYFSRRFVWETYLMVLVLTLVLAVPHAWFGVPCYPLCEEAKESLRLFLDGEFSRSRYLRYLVVYCYPSFVLCLSFFAIMMSRLCKDHLDTLAHQAQLNARLADVEKGLVLAAAAQVNAGLCPPPDALCPKETRPAEPVQPDVRDWSTTQIIKCVSRCKERAAKDPEFAALVERDPAAAVKEVRR